MAKIPSHRSVRGFSMVELLVALVFTMILMAGMATVFKASLTSFYTSGETLSSARRNRMAVDLLGDDLNTAGMYLVDLSVPPSVSSTMPPFFIVPNVAITDAGANDPQEADELYFLMDQPAPFEGTYVPGTTPARSAAELVLADEAPVSDDTKFTVECGTESYANAIKEGQVFIFKDSWETGYISGTPEVNGSKVTVVAGSSPTVGITGTGSAGIPTKSKHISGTGIVFIQPNQMVRYHIEILKLDPQNANGIPCLVRDQGTYNSAVFTPTEPQQIITENVSGFKVYLSANSGQSWAGLGETYTGFTAGWSDGIRKDLDTQLAASGRPDYKTTQGNEHWFRSIPTLVRVDVSTRTATRRTEYSSTPNTLAFRNMTQSLVFVPRHFGLSMN